VLREAEAAESAEQYFKSKVRLSGIEGEWHLLADGDSAALIDLAKSVDLAIVGQRAPNSEPDGASRLRPEDIVMTAGRPVLIVPYTGTFEMVGKRILFAWDGTREANRAMQNLRVGLGSLLLRTSRPIDSMLGLSAKEPSPEIEAR
jgi:hypothetical protein